jgi:ABC-type nickel/cobalt efflux system permease component RcnA
MSMQPHTPWFIAAMLVLVVAFAQWQIMSKLHLKRLAAERARHQRAQQRSAALLQGAHQQTATLQRELAAAREARKRVAPAAPVDDGAAARERLHQLLDEAAPVELPADGFADTQPARQFARSTTFGLLQRSTAHAM